MVIGLQHSEGIKSNLFPGTLPLSQTSNGVTSTSPGGNLKLSSSGTYIGMCIYIEILYIYIYIYICGVTLHIHDFDLAQKQDIDPAQRQQTALVQKRDTVPVHK